MRKTRALFLLTICLALLAGSALWIGWKRGWLTRWTAETEARILQSYLDQIAPTLPFKIKKYRLEHRWKDLARGRVARLELDLDWEGWNISFSGPVSVHGLTDSIGELLDEGILIELDARTTFTPPRKWLLHPDRPEPPSPLRLQFAIGLGNHFKKISLLHVAVQPANGDGSGHFAWRGIGIESDNLRVTAHWDDENGPLHLARARVSWSSLQWTRAPDRILRSGPVDLNVTLPLEIQPFYPGLGTRIELEPKSLEALWGNLYLDLPLESFSTEVDLERDSRRWMPNAARVRLGRPEWFQTRVKLNDTEFPPLPSEARWELREVPFEKFRPILENLSQTLRWPVVFRDGELQIREGTLKSGGEWNPARGLNGRLDLKNLSLDWKSRALAVRNANASLPFSSQNPMTGTISAERLLFRRLSSSLGPTRIHVEPIQNPGRSMELIPESMHLSIAGADPAPPSGAGTRAVPIRIEGIPISFSPIEGTITPEGPDLVTAVTLDPVSADQLLSPLCIDTRSFPPATVQARFSRIEITPGMIDPTGNIVVQLFGGRIEASELGLFDLLSEVPEVDFNLSARGVKLSEFSRWARFGELDGTVEIRADDVTFQSWLPTRYNLRAEVLPDQHSKIIFSADGMKNFVRVFAGESVDELPGIADWIAFGWPSRVLGGYNVNYLGISLFSADGMILVETLDPPEVVAETGRHYILKGPRFEMPLRSAHYPLVVDAITMSNYLKRMISHFSGAPAAASSAKSPPPPPLPPCQPTE